MAKALEVMTEYLFSSKKYRGTATEFNERKATSCPQKLGLGWRGLKE
jgi:hypothetical protein